MQFLAVAEFVFLQVRKDRAENHPFEPAAGKTAIT
jgi:hypothetical protein